MSNKTRKQTINPLLKVDGRKNNRPKAGKKFTKENQPKPEAKSAGWDRRRAGQEIMETIAKYMHMTSKQFANLLDDISKHPEKYTVQDVMLYKYVTKAFNGEKFMLDYVDRSVSKAPQEHTGEDGGDIGIRIKVERQGVDTPTEE